MNGFSIFELFLYNLFNQNCSREFLEIFIIIFIRI